MALIIITIKLVEQIEETINKIDAYKIAMAYDYYNNNIINDTVTDYINGNLSDKKFFNWLNNKTKIYLDE